MLGENRVLQTEPLPGQVCGGAVGRVLDKGPEGTLCGDDCTPVMAMWDARLTDCVRKLYHKDDKNETLKTG